MTSSNAIWWRHQMETFPRYWPFVREIHRWPVNFPHKGQWRGALMFSLICAWINGWVNNREAGYLRRHHTHYDVTVMSLRERTVQRVLYWCKHDQKDNISRLQRIVFVRVTYNNWWFMALNRLEVTYFAWYSWSKKSRRRCCGGLWTSTVARLLHLSSIISHAIH